MWLLPPFLTVSIWRLPIKKVTCQLKSKSLSYLSKGLQEVAARNRKGDVYVVHNEERLLLALVWKTGEVVCYKQQHVYLRFLKERRIFLLSHVAENLRQL